MFQDFSDFSCFTVIWPGSYSDCYKDFTGSLQGFYWDFTGIVQEFYMDFAGIWEFTGISST